MKKNMKRLFIYLLSITLIAGVIDTGYVYADEPVPGVTELQPEETVPSSEVTAPSEAEEPSPEDRQ